jgi:glycosyltransferase involved in cell wall biosynthesis
MVSVIIPSYNHASYLRKRIESVLNQTYPNFEIIILDDCSIDSSKKIIEQYQNEQSISHIIYNSKNSGSPFKQWQKGFELAKGEYIWIAESDDFCDDNFLEVAVKKLEENNAQIFVAKSVRVDEEGKYIDEFQWWYEDLGISRWKLDYVNDSKDQVKKTLSRKCTIINASAVVLKTEKKSGNIYLN